MSLGASLAGGAFGARSGPAFVRRLQDREQPAVLAALLLVTVLALASFGGAGVLLLAVGDDRPTRTADVVTAVVAGSLLLAAAGAVVVAAETAARWWWRGRRTGAVVLCPAPSGVPSTAVLRSRAALVTPWATGVALTTWGVVMATATGLPWWARAGLLLLALAASSTLWALVLRRASAGGVYLTTEALELRWGVVTTRVPWADLGPAGHGYPTRPLGHGVVAWTPGTTTRRSFPVQVATSPVDRPPARAAAVPSAYLSLRAPSVQAYVDLVAGSPHLRQHLGTSALLQWHVGPESPTG